jgi:hypothetical protein
MKIYCYNNDEGKSGQRKPFGVSPKTNLKYWGKSPRSK